MTSMETSITSVLAWKLPPTSMDVNNKAVVEVGGSRWKPMEVAGTIIELRKLTEVDGGWWKESDLVWNSMEI